LFEGAVAEVVGDPVGWITIALLIGALVLAFPWRHRVSLVARRTYSHPVATVWTALRSTPPYVISDAQDPHDPQARIIVVARRLTKGAAPITMRVRVVLEDPPRQRIIRIDEIAGLQFPYGNDATLSESVRETGRGSEVILIFDGLLASSLSALAMRWNLRQELRRVGSVLAEAQP
jgi:hypothetical protein